MLAACPTVHSARFSSQTHAPLFPINAPILPCAAGVLFTRPSFHMTSAFRLTAYAHVRIAPTFSDIHAWWSCQKHQAQLRVLPLASFILITKSFTLDTRAKTYVQRITKTHHHSSNVKQFTERTWLKLGRHPVAEFPSLRYANYRSPQTLAHSRLSLVGLR